MPKIYPWEGRELLNRIDTISVLKGTVQISQIYELQQLDK